ncbi:MAG TPA: hypothetical protein VEA16_23225 [Vicinamibacterales bacterium]|nr:hypothetical protein [Vicinamibacterales bacterium]
MRTVAMLVLALSHSAALSAQTGYPAAWLRSLPVSNVFALIEAAEAEVTTDRFNSGGLNVGESDRASAFLAPWSQTSYFIGDAPISSPVDGTPMVFLDTAWWDSVSSSTIEGGLQVQAVLPGHITSPSGSLEAMAAGGPLTKSASRSGAPAISELGEFARVTGSVAGGALGGRLGISGGGSWNHAITFERHGQRIRDSRSAFAQTTFAVSPSRTIHAAAVIQQDAAQLQSGFRSPHWRFFGAYSGRQRTPPPAPLQAERLVDGPVPVLIAQRTGERRATAGAFFIKRYARHSWSSGVTVDRSSAVFDPIPTTIIAERVNGIPARMWTYNANHVSRRQARHVEAYARDRLFLTSGLEVTAAIRFDGAAGSASGAKRGISWRTWLPSVHLKWPLGTPLELELTTGVSRYADRLLLGLLAYGDPNAPAATVERWDGAGVAAQPLVMRVGPGTAGEPSFSAIDTQLDRPVTDQFILQLVASPWPSVRLRVTGLARRHSSLVHVVNTGVPIGGYSMSTIADANADWVNPVDDQQLPVYDRRPETFGRDRYLLTNPDVEDATMGAFVVSAEVSKPRVVFRIGGTASASVGSGGNRGFTAFENDQTILGELFTNPNAQTFARGRLFNDRAYTIKTVTIVRLPARTVIGAIARYQDGQPFSRLAVVTGLNQGAEAIQAFANGRSRFSYRATVDLRVQKGVPIRAATLELVVDAYNLLNAASEVEEYVVTGPRFREITAIQPPRAVHVGARFTF